MKNNLEFNNLFSGIKQLIDETRSAVAQTVNSGLTMMYWNIGKKINGDILKNKRAEYGEGIVATLSRQLTNEYGSGFSGKSLSRMVQFYELFPDYKIVATLWRQLTWSHFKMILPMKDDLQREFYTQMCRIETWSVRTLRNKIDSMLFERTAISKKPEELAKLEMKGLKDKDKMTPDLVFRSPYILDFLNLKDTYQEKDLESAIISEIQRFVLELGKGFSFVERQKRMIIGNDDFYLDLLFYHRKLKRLVAVELKIGKFKAAYKGQMELYLKWLEKYEMEDGENKPIGLILCAEKNQEQVELLELDKSNIKVSEYITEILPKEVLKDKLHQFYNQSELMIEERKASYGE
ncbi:MAG: PDDEXK nuclease domain-containing protein [Candidatus Delongbacteria bacterium]|jgi:predicted nuclease of restriction endonuclease-like (RecB) superfamily|nr:PDDEXK nuclease domain-containing protein [Candidatus Delongbacteria bacterium]